MGSIQASRFGLSRSASSSRPLVDIGGLAIGVRRLRHGNVALAGQKPHAGDSK